MDKGIETILKKTIRVPLIPPNVLGRLEFVQSGLSEYLKRKPLPKKEARELGLELLNFVMDKSENDEQKTKGIEKIESILTLNITDPKQKKIILKQFHEEVKKRLPSYKGLPPETKKESKIKKLIHRYFGKPKISLPIFKKLGLTPKPKEQEILYSETITDPSSGDTYTITSDKPIPPSISQTIQTLPPTDTSKKPTQKEREEQFKKPLPPTPTQSDR